MSRVGQVGRHSANGLAPQLAAEDGQAFKDRGWKWVPHTPPAMVAAFATVMGCLICYAAVPLGNAVGDKEIYR